MLDTELFFTVEILHLPNIKMIQTYISVVILVKITGLRMKMML